jgi:hypothetical protein
MQDSLMYGSLVLAATTPVQDFPVFLDPNTLKGSHALHPFKGQYSLLIDGDFEELEVPLPSRNKYLTVTVLSEHESDRIHLANFCEDKLVAIDSMFEGARHLYKMQMLMDDLAYDEPYIICINNQSNHSYFTLLTNGHTLYVYGIYDTVNRSVRIVWTSDPQFLDNTKNGTRYVFYRYPVLKNRPMFIYSQAIISKWAEWVKIFNQPDGLLRSFNALEQFLYKDPTVANLSIQG